MNKTRKFSLLFPWLVASVAFLSISVLAIVFAVYLPDKEATLHKNLRDKTKTVAELAASGIKKALAGGDDVALLNYLQDLSNLPDVAGARVIDGDGLIIADNKIERWGKKISEVEGDKSAKLASADKPLFFVRKNPDGYDFVLPLLAPSGGQPQSARLLVVGVSSQKASSEMSGSYANALYVAVGVIFAGAVVFYIAYHLIFMVNIKKLQRALESVLLGGISERAPQDGLADEMAQLSSAVNKILDKVSANLAGARETDRIQERFVNNCVCAVAENVERAIVVLDASDTVVFVNEAAAGIIGGGKTPRDIRGKHIIDSVRDAAFLALLKKSAASVGTTVDGQVESLGATVAMSAVDSGKNQTGGTVIIFGPRK